jgi:hypothetical protein
VVGAVPVQTSGIHLSMFPVPEHTYGLGGAIVRIGAMVQPTAPLRVTPVTAPAAEIVAVASGRVVQTPPVTVTSGTVVYHAPPPFVGIAARVPVAFDIA